VTLRQHEIKVTALAAKHLMTTSIQPFGKPALS
jgi:hypothetical protein